MKRKSIILFLLFVCTASLCSFAQQTATTEQQSPELSSRRDTLLTNDSIVVIHTVCAPLCSSHVRVYNKEWKEIGILNAPFQSPFPEAYIEDGKLLWRDNDSYDYEPAP